MKVFASVLLLAAGIAEAVLPCMIGGLELSLSETVNASCAVVNYYGVALTGSFNLTINLGLIALANPSASCINVSLNSLTLRDGASLVLAGGSQSGDVPVIVTIIDLVCVDGGLLFHGAFPMATLLLVANSQFSSSGTRPSPTFSAVNHALPTVPKSVMIADLVLRNGSSLTLQNVSIQTFSIPIFICGNLLVTSGSLLLFANSSIANVGQIANNTLLIDHATLIVSENSSLQFDQLTAQSKFGGDALGISSTTVYIQGSSFWVWSGCVLQTTCISNPDSSAFAARNSSFLISGSSVWTIRGSSLVFLVMGGCSALSLVNSHMTFEQNSLWLLTASNISSMGASILFEQSAMNLSSSCQVQILACNLFAGEHCCWDFSHSKLLIADMSGLKLQSSQVGGTDSFRCIFRFFNASNVLVSGTSSFLLSLMNVTCGASCSGVLDVERSTLSITDRSVLMLDRCVFSSSNQGVIFTSFVTVLISNSSRWSFVGCVFNSSSDCIRIDSTTVMISGGSLWSIENCRLSAYGGTAFYFPQSNAIISDGSRLLFTNSVIYSSNGHSVYIAKTNVSVDGNSSWEFLSMDILGEASTIGYFLMYIVSCRWNFTSGSVWRFSRGSYQSSTIVFDVEKSQFLIMDGSAWVMEDVTLVAGAEFGMAFATSSQLVLTNQSQWVLRRMTLSVTSTAWAWSTLVVSVSKIAVRLGSLWEFSDCRFGTSLGFALSFSGAAIEVVNSSEWRMQGLQLTSGNKGDLVSFTSTTVAVSLASCWMLKNITSIATAPSNAFLSLAGSSIVLSEVSVWIIEQCAFNLLGTGNKPALQFDAKSPVSVVGGSSWILRQNSFQLRGSADACVSGAVVTLSTLGSVRLLENSCEGKNGIAFFQVRQMSYTNVDSMPFDSVLVARCNSANGVIQTDFPFVLPFQTGVLQCGTCNLVADCFLPLIADDNGAFIKLPCSTGPLCPCSPSCGGQGMMCLPGTATFSRPSTCNNRWIHPLRATKTYSESKTASQNTTTTASYDPFYTKRRAPTLGIAYVAALSASVLISGSAVASALQRAHAQQAMNSCGDGLNPLPPDFSSSPLRLRFGTTDGAEFVRGLVIGNVILLLLSVVCCAAAVTLVAYVQSTKSSTSTSRLRQIWKGAGTLELPGRLFVPYSMLCVPTVTAAAQLVTLHFDPTDGGLGWFGLATFVMPVIAIFALTTVWFGARPVRSDENSDDLSSPSLRRWFVRLFESSCTWRDSRRSRHFVSHFAAIFSAYAARRQWFSFFESSAGLATGVLVGLMPLDGNDSFCSTLQACSCLAAVGFAVLVVAMRPYGATMDYVVAVLNSGLTALSALLGMMNVSNTVALLQAQICVNIIGTGAMVVSLVIDGDAVERMKNRLQALLSSVDPAAGGTRRSCRLLLNFGSRVVATVAVPEVQTETSSNQSKLAILAELIRIICDKQREEPTYPKKR